ncbi:MAG: M48 family peptidase [Spirochaetaceae bacterium]|nr:MAG: M48 family peptidase [Spirochaetaceae bacterium]
MKRSRIQRFPIRSALLVSTIVVISACATVPGSERRQLRLIPQSELLAMSFQQYDQFLRENPISDDAAATATVREVGANIAGAVDRYLRDTGYARQADAYRWEFQLIESPQVNAWAMPGGKIAVYTGLLPVTVTEEALAVVIAHEIAHVVAEHGNERMSQALVAQMGGAALSVALRDRPEETRNLWFAAYGAGAQVGVLLPYSRLHETEADQLGLMFMAMAGYDPRAAVDFWQRMADASSGPRPPEFASTHPSNERRIRDIRDFMPRALEYYDPSAR